MSIPIPKEHFVQYDFEKDGYVVREFIDFLSDEECDQLIQIALAKGLKKSVLYTETKGVSIDENTRTSMTVWLYDDITLQKKISDRIISVLDKVPTELEAMQVVQYPTGGFFHEHYDADLADPMNKVAKRSFTFIIYLNDDFEGGGTHFPHLNYTVQPRKGKGVLFRTLDDQGQILPYSLHAGLPVSKGEKWICNKWGKI